MSTQKFSTRKISTQKFSTRKISTQKISTCLRVKLCVDLPYRKKNRIDEVGAEEDHDYITIYQTRQRPQN